MRVYGWKLLYPAGLVAILLSGGCRSKQAADGSPGLVPEGKLGTRIDSVAVVAAPEPVRVEGIGLVGGLSGTGSASCPGALRQYLRRYIMAQTPVGGYSADELINSRNTAVVRLQGVIPPAPTKDAHFDVAVSLFPGSETTSLYGGWLYAAELRPAGSGGVATRVLATVEGPVFIDRIDNRQPSLTEGWILGGGQVAGEYRGIITLRKGNYLLASRIRNRLNDRYGPNTADALSPTVLGLRIPDEYRRRGLRFLAMVGATYLDRPELANARANALVQRLAVSPDKESSEIALEAIGHSTLGKLGALLGASDEEVRLRAARCLLNLRDDRGFAVLRTIALDVNSQRRLEALQAIAAGATRNDAAVVARVLLRDRDPAIVLGAYECLRKADDLAIRREFVGRSFYVEQVAQSDYKGIYVARSGDPRIVLFGAPLQCRDNVFVESPDGMVVVNSRPGQGYVSVMRRRPGGRGIIGPLNTSFDLAVIIRALGGEPPGANEAGVPGLGVCYSDIVVLVQQMATKNMVAAEFRAGPLPNPGRIIKK
jgi:hypothetical protein